MKWNYATGVSAAFGAGLIVGAAAVRILLEKELRDKYEVQTQSFARAMERVHKQAVEAEAPVENEVELLQEEIEDVVEEIFELKLESTDYEKAMAAVETPIELFVDGGINDYGISYIEEEDFLDDDGRFKGQIEIIMDNYEPVFIMNGQKIDDWDQRVGDSILVDMYRLCPPGITAHLFVRNHKTDEDYEVSRVEP